jgi:uncharacterized protein
MAILEENKSSADKAVLLAIRNIAGKKIDLDRNIYRCSVKNKEKYAWLVSYYYTDILISSNKNIKSKIEKPLKKIYEILNACIKSNPSFLKSLSPIKIQSSFPPIIKEMCTRSAVFNVGPMAAVAGTVNEYLASYLQKYCDILIIENGGDTYIKAERDLNIGIYVKNADFKDKIALKINANNMPCGLCSSSGTFGHSFSMGKCDLAVVCAKSTITADAAATAFANSISCEDDIAGSITYFKKFEDIKGLLAIKDKKIGAWGDIEFLT